MQRGVYVLGGLAATFDFRDGVTFRKNSALDDGGSLSIIPSQPLATAQDSRTFHVHCHSGVIFESSTARSKGGAIFAQGLPSIAGRVVLRLEGVTIANSTSNRGGGLEAFDGINVEVGNHTKVSHNVVVESGGGIRIIRSALVVRGSLTVDNNRAGNDAGGMLILDSEANLVDTIVSRNSVVHSSSGAGGAVMILSSHVNMTRSVVRHNQAARAGGVGPVRDSMGQHLLSWHRFGFTYRRTQTPLTAPEIDTNQSHKSIRNCPTY